METKETPSPSTVIELILLMETGRSVSDDHWEEIDTAHIAIWEKAKKLFRVYEYKDDTGTTRIEFDWAPVLVRLRQHFRIMTLLFDPTIENSTKMALRFRKRLTSHRVAVRACVW